MRKTEEARFFLDEILIQVVQMIRQNQNKTSREIKQTDKKNIVQVFDSQ